MELKDIYFGATDAKNELRDNDEESEQRFEKAFLLPEHVNVEAFKRGDKFIIYGMKGTGKTALLRYLEIMLKKEKDVRTAFLLFKSDFTEERRKELNRNSVDIIAQNAIDKIEEKHDFEGIWRYFFFQYIVSRCTPENNIFEQDENWKTLIRLSEQPKQKEHTFFPQIKKGNLTVSVPALLGVKAGIQLEVNKKPKDQSIKLSQFLLQMEELFSKVQVVSGRSLYIMLDELELENTSDKQYKRDSCIIRDLIVTVAYINDLCKKFKFPIRIIASVRLEVLISVSAIGKEINKIIEDFGTLISWHQAGGDSRKHPLIQIIIKRLLSAEGLAEKEENINAIRERYFPDKVVQKKEVAQYILDNTWYRPRDIVRLFRLAQEHAPNENAFTHGVFDGIRKNYSLKSWTECMEEMKVRYDDTQLNAIKTIFNGWTKVFTLNEFDKRVLKLARDDDRLNSFRGKSRAILENLYRVGIIGNKYTEGENRRVRFVFRGDENLFPDKQMMIHNALVPVFSL